MSEKLYDERVAPLLMEAAKICMELNMPLLALVEYAPDKRGETRVVMPGEGLAMTMARHVVKCGVNVDAYMIGLTRYCREQGIDTSGSHYLRAAPTGQAQGGAES